MLRLTMFSSADKVKGQGVGSAYLELIALMKKDHQDEIDMKINKFSKTDISHYHTVDLKFYFTTFFRKRFGRRIGYVHFLPETLKGSIKLPFFAQKVFNWYLVSFYKRMDQLVVVNQSFVPKLEKLGIKKGRITYIPNFVSKKQFHPVDEAEKGHLREELKIPADKFVVFGAGQVQERKGIFDFVNLAKRLPEVQFVWAGGFSFGKMTDGYERYKEIVDHPPSNLLFTGIIDRDTIAHYYQVANVFLLPSYNELFPMCILEGMNCHTPILLRDLELYYSILTGYYEPAEDVDEMYKIITELATNPEYQQELRERSIAGGQYYSEERLSKVWYDFYLDQFEKRKAYEQEK